MNLPPYGLVNVSSEKIRTSLGLIKYLVIHTICVCVFEDVPVPGCVSFIGAPSSVCCVCVCVCAEGREESLSESWLLSQSHFSAWKLQITKRRSEKGSGPTLKEGSRNIGWGRTWADNERKVKKMRRKTGTEEGRIREEEREWSRSGSSRRSSAGAHY